jgi:hypothetical protein
MYTVMMYVNTVVDLFDINHPPAFILKQRFVDWILFPFSGGIYSAGPYHYMYVYTVLVSVTEDRDQH